MRSSVSSGRPPAAAARWDYLILLFFGSGDDAVSLCVDRAYRDFSRTMHGMSTRPGAADDPRDYLCNRLRALPATTVVVDQRSFDTWHKRTCMTLIARFKKSRYRKMRIGQAQKWVNMALKYIFVFGEDRLPGYAEFFGLCHVPIDNIILKSAEFRGAPAFCSAWSRIDDYEKYMDFQTWVRKRFPWRAPLAVEFEVWPNAQRDA